MGKHPRILFVQIAALGYEFLRKRVGTNWHGLDFFPARSVFPAVTCAVQGSLRTGLPPSEHGMVFNGVYLRSLRKPSFWEQSSALVDGPRIWAGLRERGGTAGMLFWQQSLGEEVDVLLSPWPVHTHGGRLVDTTHDLPGGLYERLCADLGRPFRLRDYWGPLSNRRSSRWIAEATAQVLRGPHAPDLLFSYLPHLDYALQKHGPDAPQADRALRGLLDLLAPLVDTAREQGADVVLCGDYAIGTAREALLPNRVLREAGAFATRNVAGRLYPNFHDSRACAIVDHEVAHVYLRSPQSDRDAVRGILRENLPETVSVLTAAEFAAGEKPHRNVGDLVLAGAPGTWFAYPWWRDGEKPPDYATHIDIHNKPGFDPCELFFGRTPMSVATDPAKVRGTHGAVDPGREIAWASTCNAIPRPETLLDVANSLQDAVLPCGIAPDAEKGNSCPPSP